MDVKRSFRDFFSCIGSGLILTRPKGFAEADKDFLLRIGRVYQYDIIYMGILKVVDCKCNGAESEGRL